MSKVLWATEAPQHTLVGLDLEMRWVRHSLLLLSSTVETEVVGDRSTPRNIYSTTFLGLVMVRGSRKVKLPCPKSHAPVLKPIV